MMPSAVNGTRPIVPIPFVQGGALLIAGLDELPRCAEFNTPYGVLNICLHR